MIKKNLIIAIAILCIISIFCIMYLKNLSKMENSIEEMEKSYKEVVISQEINEIVEQTKKAILNNEDISTNEKIECSEEEEKYIEEENLEEDGTVEQENISYNGDITGNGLALLGKYQGLTYYNQADSRWANVLYTSTNNSSQTMKLSGCGVTAGAIVVSSSKGAILPTTMAQLSVDNGYRTANNGTAWSFFSFIADYFGFNEFYTTYSFSTALNYLKTDKDNDGISDYYVVVSCRKWIIYLTVDIMLF